MRLFAKALFFSKLLASKCLICKFGLTETLLDVKSFFREVTAVDQLGFWISEAGAETPNFVDLREQLAWRYVKIGKAVWR